MSPQVEKFLRYLSAYALFAFFILLGFGICWFLRSDLLALCLVFKIPVWISYIVSGYGIFVMLIPLILFIGWLEPYLNKAAKNKQVIRQALRVLYIEGGIALVVFGLMGALALAGYPIST